VRARCPRIAFGSVAPTVVRVPRTEQALAEGASISEAGAILQQEIAHARQDLAEYRRQRVSAPSDSLVKKTVGDYDEAIANRQADIARYEADLEGVKHAFAAELRAMGLELNDSQLDFMLSTVVGDNLIDLGILFDNIGSALLSGPLNSIEGSAPAGPVFQHSQLDHIINQLVDFPGFPIGQHGIKIF